MHRLCCVLALFATLLASGAEAGWENTEWGMTPEEVRVVTPVVLETNPLLASGGIRGEAWAVVLSEVRKHDEPGTSTHYFFDDGGLVVVFQYNLLWGDGATSACDGALDDLIAEYGVPQTEGITQGDAPNSMDYLFSKGADGTLVKVRNTMYDDDSGPFFEVCLIGFHGRTD